MNDHVFKILPDKNRRFFAFIDRNDPETVIEVEREEHVALMMADNAGYQHGTPANRRFEGMHPLDAASLLAHERGVDFTYSIVEVLPDELWSVSALVGENVVNAVSRISADDAAMKLMPRFVEESSLFLEHLVTAFGERDAYTMGQIAASRREAGVPVARFWFELFDV